MRIDGVLDSTIVIDLLRSNQISVDWYESLGRWRVAITPVVWMETVQGARDKIERQQTVRFLNRFTIEHPTANDNHWAMRQLAQFHLSHGIEMGDVMIASVAARLNVPLYTLNIKHYQPLPAVLVQRPY